MDKLVFWSGAEREKEEMAAQQAVDKLSDEALRRDKHVLSHLNQTWKKQDNKGSLDNVINEDAQVLKLAGREKISTQLLSEHMQDVVRSSPSGLEALKAYTELLNDKLSVLNSDVRIQLLSYTENVGGSCQIVEQKNGRREVIKIKGEDIFKF